MLAATRPSWNDARGTPGAAPMRSAACRQACALSGACTLSQARTLSRACVRSLAWILSLACTLAVHAAPPTEGPFASAAVAPPDATVLLRIRDAKGLRSDGTLLPAQAALARMAGTRVLGDAWGKIAAELGTDGAGMVDLVLGADATYLERVRGDAIEWAIVTRIEQPVWDLLVARLKPSIEGGGRVSFAAQRVAAAWRPPFLLLGGGGRRALLDEVLARVDATAPLPSLADHADLATPRGWDASSLEMFWRHSPPVGGSTVMAARAANGALRVRHRSHWDAPPIHVAAGAVADAGLLRALEASSIGALAMNPWRGALDPAEPLDALLLEGQFDDAMRANLGARQVVVLGDRALEGSRLRVPTMAVAFEVRDAVLAEKQWDGWARRLVENLGRRVGESTLPAVTTGAPGAAGTPRLAAIDPLVQRLFSEHPLLRGTQLAWTTASTPNGAWQIVASDPALLEPVAKAIAGAAREPDPDGAHELGILSGRALAMHMRTWAAESTRFAPESPEAFSQSVALAADIATAAQRVRWRAKSPEAQVVESEVVIELPVPAVPLVGPPAPERAP